ncbi:MAG: MnmC family methyltransferase [Chthoniobacteraceae bacterium]
MTKETPAMPDPLSLGEYRIHTAREGFSSILHVASGEIMHSRVDPMAEAHGLYSGQAHLAERLQHGDLACELVVWDVGLGAAANAMSALEIYEQIAASGRKLRPLRIISFENDLDSLRLALRHPDRFPYLQHEGPVALVERCEWTSDRFPGLSWQLVPGDFPETIARASHPPEVIYYDMYSTKTCATPWLPETFRRLFAACAGRGAELFTYTVSTASRLAMLSSGFQVARGRSMGGKEETTIAFTPQALINGFAARHELLGGEWLAKWQRSAARFPAWLEAADRETFTRQILERPQFRNWAGQSV